MFSETSTGVKSDPKQLTKLAHDYNCLSIVDTVTGLAGIPLMVDEWGIDAIYLHQKCLSASLDYLLLAFQIVQRQNKK